MRATWDVEMAAGLIALALFASGCGSQDPPESATEDPLQLDGELLEELGYVQWSDDLDERSEGLSGVVRHDPSRSQPGLNLYARKNGRANLLDASGATVHEWARESGTWKVALLLPGGDLLAMSMSGIVMRLGWDSKVIWRRDIKAHHDLTLDSEGNIYC